MENLKTAAKLLNSLQANSGNINRVFYPELLAMLYTIKFIVNRLIADFSVGGVK
jgi:hypothetical protein